MHQKIGVPVCISLLIALTACSSQANGKIDKSISETAMQSIASLDSQASNSAFNYSVSDSINFSGSPESSKITSILSVKSSQAISKIAKSKTSSKKQISSFLAKRSNVSKANSSSKRTPSQSSSSSKVSKPVSFTEEQKRALEAVNAARKKAGCTPLKLDEQLCKAAQARSVELKENYSHTRPNGSFCDTIFAEFGITKQHWGENISYHIPDDTVEAVCDSFYGSEPHRENILDKGFTRFGIGHSVMEIKYGSPMGEVDTTKGLWVQIFMK